MPKQRERSELEWYKAEIRTLKKQVKSLQRELKQYQKIQHMFEISQDEEVSDDNEDTYPKASLCQSCGKGKLEVIDIIGRRFQVCQLCGDRKKLNG